MTPHGAVIKVELVLVSWLQYLIDNNLGVGNMHCCLTITASPLLLMCALVDDRYGWPAILTGNHCDVCQRHPGY